MGTRKEYFSFLCAVTCTLLIFCAYKHYYGGSQNSELLNIIPNKIVPPAPPSKEARSFLNSHSQTRSAPAGFSVNSFSNISRGDYPYAVSIFKFPENIFLGSATLISEYHMLTGKSLFF